MTHVAVVVPGIMGSELRLNGEVVWPGPFIGLVFGFDDADMNKLLQDDLVATDVIRSYSISKQYRVLIDDLATCGFREDSQPQTLYLCPYDWRKSNVLSAGKLADLVDDITQKGATEITLIGHSMGGMVCRYYLESGDFAARPGIPVVRRLLTLATPHRGSPVALSAAIGQEKQLFLSAAQVHQLASDPRFPSLYQLLPPRGEPFAWNEDDDSAFGEIDIYRDDISAALGLAPENMQAALAFHDKLDLTKRPQFQGAPVRYFFFVGTRQTTASVATLLELQANKYRVRLTELEGAGDGTVPAWSGALTGIQNQPVGGEHSTIYRNNVLRRTMAALLGKKGVLAAEPEHVEVSLRERVANPGTLVHASLSFEAGVDKLDGRLVIQRMSIDESSGSVTYSNPVSVFPISYSGLNAEKLSVIFSAPDVPDLYRVAYYPVGYDEPAGSDELFVQQN